MISSSCRDKRKIENGSDFVSCWVCVQKGDDFNVYTQFFFGFTNGGLLSAFAYFNKPAWKIELTLAGVLAANTIQNFIVFDNKYGRTDSRVDPIHVTYFTDVAAIIFLGGKLTAFNTITSHEGSIAFCQVGFELGRIQRPEADLRILANARQSTHASGSLVVELSKEPHKVTERGVGGSHTRNLNTQTGFLSADWAIFDEGEILIRSGHFSQTVYPKADDIIIKV